MVLKQKLWVVAVLHLALFSLSFLLAWMLHFDFRLPSQRMLVEGLPILLGLRLLAMGRFNLLHGYWGHSSSADLMAILKATSVSSAFFLLIFRGILWNAKPPLPFYIVEAMIAVGMLSAVRLGAVRQHKRSKTPAVGTPKKKVVVVGAGEAAGVLLREMLCSEFLPVACVDDNPYKHGATLHSVPILGAIDRLPAVVMERNAEEVFIAIPSAKPAEMLRISQICEKCHVRFRTIPNVRELLIGQVLVAQLRDVKPEDLLGRDAVELDTEHIRMDIQGKVVMVTGAAGSIGSELCRQVLRYGPAKLIALDQAETPLFYLQLQLNKDPNGESVVYCVGSINDGRYMQQILLEHGVNIVFHAAAYKHVPMVEENVRAALQNNIFGLLSLLEIAEDCSCGTFLLISSDKAVHPTSFMGATKRVGELMLASRESIKMRCIAVRFGNVLGSQGSVIPVFKEQIAKENRVTVTHPEITRYFMTIPEAVSLVLQGFALGRHGDILVLDMGKPIRIVDLAYSLIRLCGRTPADVKIEFTGLRKGEKLYEELFYPYEDPTPTTHHKVKRTSSHVLKWKILAGYLKELAALAHEGCVADIRLKMKQMVPEYSYEESLLEAEQKIPPALQALQINPNTLAATMGQD